LKSRVAQLVPKLTDSVVKTAFKKVIDEEQMKAFTRLPVPESFIRAIDDFKAGRFVDMERALNEPPAPEHETQAHSQSTPRLQSYGFAAFKAASSLA